MTTWNPMAQSFEPGTQTPAAFLLARIGEDQAAAERMTTRDLIPGRSWSDLPYEERFGERLDEILAPPRLVTDEEWMDWYRHEGVAGDDLVERMTPARVLAECEAKRRIVALHDTGGAHECVDAAGFTGYEHYCLTLRLLAYPFRGHPDWREEWTPQ